jgi:hypothetical protein
MPVNIAAKDPGRFRTNLRTCSTLVGPLTLCGELVNNVLGTKP